MIAQIIGVHPQILIPHRSCMEPENSHFWHPFCAAAAAAAAADANADADATSAATDAIDYDDAHIDGDATSTAVDNDDDGVEGTVAVIAGGINAAAAAISAAAISAAADDDDGVDADAIASSHRTEDHHFSIHS